MTIKRNDFDFSDLVMDKSIIHLYGLESDWSMKDYLCIWKQTINKKMNAKSRIYMMGRQELCFVLIIVKLIISRTKEFQIKYLRYSNLYVLLGPILIKLIY